MTFFKHQTNMRHDTSIRKLILKYGLKGYGLYNIILESIAEKLTVDDIVPDLKESCDDIALLFNENSSEINEITCWMINEGLLELDEITTRVMCKKIYKFLELSQTRSRELREMIRSYKNPRLVTSMTNLKETDADADADADAELNILQNFYPVRCVNSNRILNRSVYNKKKLKELVSKHGLNHLKKILTLYIADCRRTGRYMKDFKTLVNNFPAREDFNLAEEKGSDFENFDPVDQ